MYNIDGEILTSVWTSPAERYATNCFRIPQESAMMSSGNCHCNAGVEGTVVKQITTMTSTFSLRRRRRRWLPADVTGNDLLSSQSPVPMVRPPFPYSRWSSLHQPLTIIGLLRWHRRHVMDTRRRRQTHHQRALNVDIYIHYPSIKKIPLCYCFSLPLYLLSFSLSFSASIVSIIISSP